MFQGYNPYMNYGLRTSKFTFSNILNTAQKTLNIVNQALPIIKEVKPIVKNARTLFSVAKGFNNIPEQTKETKIGASTNNGPNFFI